MPTDSLSKVSSGQPLRIPADAYNAFIDAAKANKGMSQDVSRTSKRERTDGLVLIKNTSGSPVPRFGVLGVDGPLFDPSDFLDAFKRDVVLTGSTPAINTHVGKFVIALEPIAAGAMGKACAVGVCITQVQFPDPNVSQPEFADIGDGVTANLVAQERGAAAILWHETVPPGGATKWAIVRVGDSNTSSMFPVDLTQVGGEDGSDVGPATWTYDVFDALDTIAPALETEVDPVASPSVWARPATGAVAKATAGLAFYDATGALAIAWINEVFAGGAGGDFQAYFIHAVRVDSVVTAAPIVGNPGTITYDIKVDPLGSSADFTGVAPTHSRETNSTGQIIAAAIGDVCAAKIGLDGQQNPIVEQLILQESEPQKLLVANDDEPASPIVAPWVGHAGSIINNPTRLEVSSDGSGGTDLKLITQELSMALKSVLPTAAAGPDQQDQADPFVNKLILGASIGVTEITLSTVNIPGGAGGVTAVVLVPANSLAAFSSTVIVGDILAPNTNGLAASINASAQRLDFHKRSLEIGAKIDGSLLTIAFKFVDTGATIAGPPLKIGLI